MSKPIEEATAYLQKLQTDRRAAIEISDQKAEEAKLIAARQEGFQAAMDIFCAAIPVNVYESKSEKSGSRRRRRDICEMIIRELSFSGEAMTTTQIGKAIDYITARTETALKRLEKAGKVVRTGNSRWAALVDPITTHNGQPQGPNLKSLPTC
jgi:hypothetical protein